jgi:hypothetical protein
MAALADVDASQAMGVSPVHSCLASCSSLYFEAFCYYMSASILLSSLTV